MPREVAKHKELLDDIFKIQDKLEELSSEDLLKDEAFRQLSNINKELYDKIEITLRKLQFIKDTYSSNIYRSRWAQSHDPTYHRRQVKSREYKLLHKEQYEKCSCGELISSRFFKKHLMTDKHVSSMIRIDIEKNENKRNNLLKPSNLGLLMVIGSQISYYKNGTDKHKYIGKIKILGMTRMEWLSMFIRRWKIKRM
jgi:hypothetical protein